MSTHEPNWHPDDGAPPTDDERRDARRLAEALDGTSHPAVVSPELRELLAIAGRVRATVRPDPHAARAAADRAVRHALQSAARPTRAWEAWWSPARVRFAAAAATVLALAGVGGGAYLRARWQTQPPQEVPVFDAPVQPGAGSAPASRLYDHSLRGYRDALLRGAP
jgi:hypothetical protein